MRALRDEYRFAKTGGHAKRHILRVTYRNRGRKEALDLQESQLSDASMFARFWEGIAKLQWFKVEAVFRHIRGCSIVRRRYHGVFAETNLLEYLR